MFYLIDYVDAVGNVCNFLRRTKLISLLFKKIKTKQYFVTFVLISQSIFERTKLSTKKQYFMVSFKVTICLLWSTRLI